jgi:hypothetical protein
VIPCIGRPAGWPMLALRSSFVSLIEERRLYSRRLVRREFLKVRNELRPQKEGDNSAALELDCRKIEKQGVTGICQLSVIASLSALPC